MASDLSLSDPSLQTSAYRAVESAPASARDRIINTSYELFARRGIRDVGVDELIARSGVAKATFYRHFPSKDDLVIEFLERWFQARTYSMEAAILRAEGHNEPVLVVFDVLDDWVRNSTAEASAFLHVLMEMGPEHPLGKASIEFMTRTREQLADLARSAGLANVEDFAWSLHILIKGAMVAALEGDQRAAGRAHEMAQLLVEKYRGA